MPARRTKCWQQRQSCSVFFLNRGFEPEGKAARYCAKSALPSRSTTKTGSLTRAWKEAVIIFVNAGKLSTMDLSRARRSGHDLLLTCPNIGTRRDDSNV